MSHWIFQEEHEMVRKSIRKFVDKEVLPQIEVWEREGALPRMFLERCGELGYLGLSVAEAYGGSQTDLITEAVLFEELGRCGSLGVASSIGYHTGCAMTLISCFGTEEQKSQLLPPAVRGERILALSVSEPSTGSDVGSIQTYASRDGNEYVLNGVKKFVTNGLIADTICMAVKTDPTKEKEGVSLLMVDTASPGFSITHQSEVLGWRSSNMAEIKLENVRVPVNRLLGDENQGYAYLSRITPWQRIMFSLFSVGLAERSMQDTMLYSKQRKQFGQTLNQFQVLQHKMVDMAVEIEKTKNLAYRALYLLGQGQDAEIEATMAKAYAGEMIKQVTDSSVQIHGGMGYMMETPVQRYWRDARALSISGGTTQLMNENLTRRLGITEA
jgi:acyl-CoA dehydrogenase